MSKIMFAPPQNPRRALAQQGAEPQPDGFQDPRALEQRMRLAQQLAQQAGDTSPVGHWTQALARGVQGISAGMQQNQIAEQQKRAQADAAQSMGSMAGGGAASPEMIQRMLRNPRTAPMAQKIIMQQRAANQPLSEGQRLELDIKRERLAQLQQRAPDEYTRRMQAGSTHGLEGEQLERFVLTGKLETPGSANTPAQELQRERIQQIRESRAAKMQQAQAAQQEEAQKGINLRNGLENLNKATTMPGFDNAVGQFQGGESSIWGAPARAVNDMLSPGNQREIRAKIEGDTRALSAAIKPLIRKPGEGTFTDADQRQLDQILGDLSGAGNTEEYRRRLLAVRDRVQSNLNVDMGRLSFEGQNKNQSRLPDGFKIERID